MGSACFLYYVTGYCMFCDIDKLLYVDVNDIILTILLYTYILIKSLLFKNF